MRSPGGAGVGAQLGEDSLEPGLRLRVEVRHRRRDRRVDGRDLRVHLVGDGAVARVAFPP